MFVALRQSGTLMFTKAQLLRSVEESFLLMCKLQVVLSRRRDSHSGQLDGVVKPPYLLLNHLVILCSDGRRFPLAGVCTCSCTGQGKHAYSVHCCAITRVLRQESSLLEETSLLAASCAFQKEEKTQWTACWCNQPPYPSYPFFNRIVIAGSH